MDKINRKYSNPIIYADYSDPDAIRVGDDYYMTASSFSNVPGLPVLHSRDLVHWKLINYALKKIPEFRYREPMHGCGVWAPAIRYHEGLFYICFPMPDEGIYMITAKDPAGEWSECVKLYDGAGFIDPCPFWDEDGNAYLVNGVAKSRIGYKSVLWLSGMSADGMRLISEPVKIYDGTADGNVTTEGPKMYKRNGYYYIFAPAGGVKTGWQIVLRSRNIYGPYEARTVMRQGSTGVNGPHQGAWVDAIDTRGRHSDWFLHFQDVFAAGRITHLQPMQWTDDDWPVIGKPSGKDKNVGEPVSEWEIPLCRGAVKDNDNNGHGCDEKLYGEIPPWQWNANPEDSWIAKKSGSITDSIRVKHLTVIKGKSGKGEDEACAVPVLNAVKVSEQRPLCDYPNLLLRRVEAPELCAEAELDLSGLRDGAMAGMVSMGCIYAGAAIKRERDSYYLVLIRGQQFFDRGAVYAKEQKDVTEIELKDPAHVYFTLVFSPSNDVTAISAKPEYIGGDNEIILHPQESIIITVGGVTQKPLKYSDHRPCINIPAVAGRWVGVKYGFFHVMVS